VKVRALQIFIRQNRPARLKFDLFWWKGRDNFEVVSDFLIVFALVASIFGKGRAPTSPLCSGDWMVHLDDWTRRRFVGNPRLDCDVLGWSMSSIPEVTRLIRSYAKFAVFPLLQHLRAIRQAFGMESLRWFEELAQMSNGGRKKKGR
jgi:hypothetical protein